MLFLAASLFFDKVYSTSAFMLTVKPCLVTRQPPGTWCRG
jgi:hypothetical protein